MRRPRRFAVQAVDAGAYALAVLAVALVPTTVLSFATGNGWVGVKTALFVGGFILFGYATLKLRPEPASKRLKREHGTPDSDDGDDGDDGGDDPFGSMGMFGSGGVGGGNDSISSEDLRSNALSDDESGIAGRIHSVPPLSELDVSPEDRASAGVRLMTASVVMLATSFVMEVVFRVGY